jgi:hypothetical protein
MLDGIEKLRGLDGFRAGEPGKAAGNLEDATATL